MFSKTQYSMTEEIALLDFHIDIYSYESEINDLDDIISLKIGSLLYKDINHFYKTKNWKKVIEKMNLWYSNIMMSLKKPNLLTDDEKKPIKEMEKYLKENEGKLTGAYSYRRKYYLQKVEQYKNLVFKNKMTILAFKDEISERVTEYREILNKWIERDGMSYQIRRENDKRKWGQQFYTCKCEKEVQKVNKSHHEKSVFHKNWLKDNEPDEFAILCNSVETWQNKKYKCSCGKNISNSNKSNHEKTNYHNMYKADDNEDNIVMTIQEIE
jgi:hypothetical protein